MFPDLSVLLFLVSDNFFCIISFFLLCVDFRVTFGSSFCTSLLSWRWWSMCPSSSRWVAVHLSLSASSAWEFVVRLQSFRTKLVRKLKLVGCPFHIAIEIRYSIRSALFFRCNRSLFWSIAAVTRLGCSICCHLYKSHGNRVYSTIFRTRKHKLSVFETRKHKPIQMIHC